MKKTLYLLLSISALTFTQLFAQKLNSPIPNNPAVKTGVLKNGMKYYILKNAEPKNRMELRLVVNAGSVLENDQQQGLAHFMEHMAFNGTKEFPKNEMVNFLQRAGMKFGADLNASTSFDETIYKLLVPTDSVRLFERSFQVLEDWAHNALLDTSEINKERGVVLEEERLRGKNAQSRIQQKVLPLIFFNSRYAERIPIGKTDILKNFKPEVLNQFYKDWYRPDLMSVVAVGDFDEARVEALIQEKFSRIAKTAKNAPKRTKYQIPLHPDTKISVIIDPEFPQSNLQMITKLPREKTVTQADFRQDIVEALYNSMLNNRLQEISKKPNSPFVFAVMSYSEFIGGIDAFQRIVLPKNAESMETAIKSLIDEGERVRKFGFTKGELERVKKEYFTGIEKAYKEKDKTKSANLVNGMIQNFLSGASYPSIDFRFEFVQSQLEGIALEEVNKLSDKLFKEENTVVILVGSEKDKDKLPNEAKLKELISFKNPDLKPYEDEVVDMPILDKIPTGSKVVSEKKVDEIGVTEIVFENGVKAVLKPTTFKNDQIIFSGSSNGGTSLYSDADYYNAEVASMLVSQSGIGNISDTQLDKMMAGKVANAYTFIDEISEGVGGSSSPKDFETALQLLYGYVTKPRRDDDVIKSFLKNQKELVANSFKTPTPEKVFGDSVSAIFYNKHFRRMPMKPEVFEQINIDRAYEIYKERFADMSDFTFVFVGNFEVEKIKPLLEKYIGGLPSTKRNESFKDLNISPVKGKVEKTVYKGLEDKSAVRLYFTGNYDYNTDNNINLNALVEVLKIKLTESLREEESGVYSPSVGFSSSKYPKAEYSINVSFGCAPANVERLIARTLAEINKIKQDGPTKVDFEKVIAEEKRDTEVQLKENGFWSSYLLDQYTDNEDVMFIKKYEKDLINSISVESIKKAANTFFGDNYARFVLLPEKK